MLPSKRAMKMTTKAIAVQEEEEESSGPVKDPQVRDLKAVDNLSHREHFNSCMCVLSLRYLSIWHCTGHNNENNEE